MGKIPKQIKRCTLRGFHEAGEGPSSVLRMRRQGTLRDRAAMLPVALVLILLALLLPACEEGISIVGHAERVRFKVASQNHCATDSDCVTTGCRGTNCRALPDERSCIHRLVLSVEGDEAPSTYISAVRGLVGPVLTVRERETLQIHPRDGGLLVSFHASLVHREAVISSLEGLSGGGFYALHPNSERIVDAVLEAGVDRAVRAKVAEGGPRLLELSLESGDVLSLADVDAATSRLRAALEGHIGAGSRVAFEPLLDTHPAVVRAWIVDTRSVVDLAEMESLEMRPHEDGANSIFEGRFTETAQEGLAGLTTYQKGRPVVLLVGQDVLAAPLVKEPVVNGHFELKVRTTKGDRSALERLERARSAPPLARAVRFDEEGTSAAEGDIECLAARPPLTQCRCIEGFCAWEESEELDACMSSGEGARTGDQQP